MESNHPLICLADADQQDAGGAEPTVGTVSALDLQLVTGDEWHAAPRDDLNTEDIHRRRRGSAPRAFAREGCDRLGMCQEEGRLLPDQRQQLVQVIRRRRAVARADAEGRRDRIDQTELLVVDQLPFLPLLDAFNGQPDLLFELVVGAIEQVRHPGVHPHHRLHGGEGILAGRGGVVDESFWNFNVFGKSGDQVDVPLAVFVDGGQQRQVLFHRFLETGPQL